MKLTMIDQFRRARKASVPILAIETTDQPATTKQLTIAVQNGSTPPVYQWDIVQGITPRNQPALDNLDRLLGDRDAMTLTNPTEMLACVSTVKDRSIVIMLNAHLYFTGDNRASVVQGIANLREPYKQCGATLVMLAPTFSIPSEIAQDVMIISDPLPDMAQIRQIVIDTCNAAGMSEPPDIEKICDTLIGLSAFSAEQTLATCIFKDDKGIVDIDRDSLWDKKCKAIEQTPGLSIYRGADDFKNLKDLDNLEEYLRSLVTQYSAIVFVDEIEKAFAGNAGDTSGVSQDIHGVWLTWLQDNEETDGIILIGHPGTGKSAIAKAAGNAGRIPTIVVDPNGMKSKYIGESGQQTRQAFKVIDAVSSGRSLVIATCNSIEALSPELKRRFTLGTFFCDLPSENGRKAMWAHYGKVYGVKTEHSFDDTGWTGAEIKQTCRLAKKLSASVDKASTYIVPVCRASGERIETLRNQASGKFISASVSGVYQKRIEQAKSSRSFDLN